MFFFNFPKLAEAEFSAQDFLERYSFEEHESKNLHLSDWDELKSCTKVALINVFYFQKNQQKIDDVSIFQGKWKLLIFADDINFFENKFFENKDRNLPYL